jgi:hypothetical protein
MSSMMFDPSMLAGAGQPEPEPEPQQSGPDILQNVLDLLAQYQQVEQDAEDLAEGADLVARIRKLLAKQQQEADQMLGGKLTPRAVRRAASSAGGY